MDCFTKIYDISVTLGTESSFYPEDKPYIQTREMSHEKGDQWNVSRFQMSAHSGSHVDIPFHLFAGKDTIEKIPPEKFILSAWVVDVKNKETVNPSELESADISPGDAVLFKTRNSNEGIVTKGEFTSDYVYIASKTADLCVEKRLSLVGIDYLSVDKLETDTYPIHHTLLGNNIFILENINLREVPQGKYKLLCLPLKIAGAEASPVRALLLK